MDNDELNLPLSAFEFDNILWFNPTPVINYTAMVPVPKPATIGRERRGLGTGTSLDRSLSREVSKEVSRQLPNPLDDCYGSLRYDVHDLFQKHPTRDYQFRAEYQNIDRTCNSKRELKKQMMNIIRHVDNSCPMLPAEYIESDSESEQHDDINNNNNANSSKNVPKTEEESGSTSCEYKSSLQQSAIKIEKYVSF